MPSTVARVVRCQISGREVPLDQALPADLVRESLLPTLKELAAEEWDPNGYVSIEELNRARQIHVDRWVNDQDSRQAELRREVMHSIEERKILSRDIYGDFERELTFGEKMADKIATFGGSWRFIGLFGAVILVWMTLNGTRLLPKAFDPYPFILLNLVLSCLAALQAPVIMMSQNRQEERDRLRAENDYKVNLKAELEIRHLNEKVDRLLNEQWKHLLEIQQMQMDMIEEQAKTRSHPPAE
jgi:uncharacterized membrane protein